jgi:hypothetical protein
MQEFATSGRERVFGVVMLGRVCWGMPEISHMASENLTVGDGAQSFPMTIKELQRRHETCGISSVTTELRHA